MGWWDSFVKPFRDKESPHLKKLLLFFCLGAAILLASTFFYGSEAERQSEGTGLAEIIREQHTGGSNYERELEKRLQEVLALINGAGEVEVMLTFSGSREIILAEDVTTNESTVIEVDSAGGTRENRSLANDIRTILVQSSRGGQEPIILREIVPKVEGVIIVAEGGDDIFVKEALMRATSTVLGVDIHRVRVLQMNRNR
ncbi:MAG: hypothetical protein FWE24_00590 [Defluviitaleaceae bacterium]|nr:hypothetical protein [Defluviitaleaceae bacterium]